MEENKRFSWTDLFIKVIIVIVFILFVVWLLSLSNKGLSNSLNVLTEDIFVQNIERMKEVGKEYFTVERLPEKVGEIETLTLKEMYEKKLILEVKDKNGNACDADNSYVSIEKMENEYQMKVNLECGEEEDYIIVIMGCYDYCDTDICEKKENTTVKDVEYQYKKTTGGKWTDYGKWSEWSKVSVTKTDYRQVETKIVNEEYTYDKVVVNTLYDELEISCPEGYMLNSDSTKCFKVVTTTATANPVCPTVDGYTVNRNGFTCNYSKTTTTTTNPVCPTVDGYTVSRNGFTCNYSKTTTENTDPMCPFKDGWTFVSRNDFTCNYSKEVSTPYQSPVTSPKYCYKQEVVISCTGCSPVIQNVPYQCGTTTTYVTKYTTTTETTTDTAVCPSGYSQSGNTCSKSIVDTKTGTASCPSGYSQSGNTCSKSIVDTKTSAASCPSGYSQSGNTCSKTETKTVNEVITKTCLDGYKLTSDGTKCYKNENTTIKIDGVREVTYYRYRIREYVGGTVDYKWSKSKEDKELLNAGYVLTGKTR